VIEIRNWRKSTYSQGANACVEIGSAPTMVGVRDTKLGTSGPILAFGRESWSTFIRRTRETTR
jgi:uncharacterized protein DUF397